MSVVDTTMRGKRYGDLTVEYRVDRRVAVRCRCTRLIFVAEEELANGVTTSCGCSAPSLARVSALSANTTLDENQSAKADFGWKSMRVPPREGTI
jgi:hypothetical protein